MKKSILACLIAFICLSLAGPVFGFWKEKVTRNQIRVLEYVTKLKQGAKPGEVERPRLRRDDNYQAKQSNKELADIMDAAEKLASEGKNESITSPKFSIRGLSDERAKELLGVVPDVQ